MRDDPKWRSRAEFQSSTGGTDPDPNPLCSSSSSSYMSSQLATGVWHPSYGLKPNLQAKDSCDSRAAPPSFLTCRYSPGARSLGAEPVGQELRVVPDNMLDHVGCDAQLCVSDYLQLKRRCNQAEPMVTRGLFSTRLHFDVH